VSVIAARDVRGTGSHGRVAGAPGFPQAIANRIRFGGKDFGQRKPSARQDSRPPYCVYWMDKLKD
jgi:hypothetical protein